MTAYPWLKLWNEFVEDDKFPAAADMVGSTPAVAEATFLRLMAYANQQRDRGSIAGFHPQRIASRLRVSVAEIRGLILAFRELGMLLGERIANWAKRQTEKLPKPRSAGAERQARFRQKQAAAARQGVLELGATIPVTPNEQALQTGVTSAAEEEEDYSEANASESREQLSAPVVQITDYQREVKGDGGRTRRSRIAPAWQPDDRDHQYAEAYGYDREWVERQAERFRDHHLKKGSIFADWHAAWRNWVQRDTDFGGSNSAGRSTDDRGGGSPLTIALRRLMPAGDPGMASRSYSVV